MKKTINLPQNYLDAMKELLKAMKIILQVLRKNAFTDSVLIH